MAHHAKLAFFGTDTFSDTTLRALIENGYDISVVVTKPDAPVGRKRIMTPPAVKVTAQSHNIRVLQPERAIELVDTLQGQCEAGIVIAYGKILPQAVLDLFPSGLINIHGSLLPKYRGASPIEAALLNGDAVTGVSVMKLDAGMDTGPVYAEAQYEILHEDNQNTLYEKLAAIGADILIRDLDSILSGNLKAHPQDDSKATKVGMIKKSDGEINWNKSAIEIVNQIRAYSSWPGSKATIAGEDVTITAASVIVSTAASVMLSHAYRQTGEAETPMISHGSFDEAQDDVIPGTPFKTEAGELAVACGDQAIIIHSLKPAGKREMTGKEFLAGHPISKKLS